MSTELPHLQLMCLALDNASNYHRKELQQCIPVLNTILLGVELDKNIHKETKDGKGGCDSHGGNAEQHIHWNFLLSRDEVTEYKKVDMPKQHVEALALNGGIQNNGMCILQCVC